MSSAGCFAASAGFLLNFTIHELPPSNKTTRSRRDSPSHTPLAPDSHRLTDDAEYDQPPDASRSQDVKGAVLRNGMKEAMHGLLPHNKGEDEGLGRHKGSVQNMKPEGRLQVAVAQVKVGGKYDILHAINSCGLSVRVDHPLACLLCCSGLWFTGIFQALQKHVVLSE